jgi:hypothetical protein
MFDIIKLKRHYLPEFIILSQYLCLLFFMAVKGTFLHRDKNIKYKYLEPSVQEIYATKIPVNSTGYLESLLVRQ